jgi:hypothetical protein
MSMLSSVYTGVHSVIHDIEDRLHRMYVRVSNGLGDVGGLCLVTNWLAG